jgi:hypothetical protein
MKLSNILLAACTVLYFTIGCNSNKMPSSFHMDKKYWTPDDYTAAIDEIKYRIPEGEKLPCYSVPDKAAIFQKLVDINNLSVVLEDNSLGLKYRDEFGDRMFDQYRTLYETYSELDRQDKYVYPVELVDIMKFGFYLQIHAFKIGNDKILKDATDTSDYQVRNIIEQNEQTVVDNFCLYLDRVNKEDAFSPDALNGFHEAIDLYFPQLIKTFAKASYGEMQSKTDLLLNKVKDPGMKKSLEGLKALLDEKNKPAEPEKVGKKNQTQSDGE